MVSIEEKSQTFGQMNQNYFTIVRLFHMFRQAELASHLPLLSKPTWMICYLKSLPMNSYRTLLLLTFLVLYFSNYL